jgi:hypothetical protein
VSFPATRCGATSAATFALGTPSAFSWSQIACSVAPFRRCTQDTGAATNRCTRARMFGLVATASGAAASARLGLGRAAESRGLQGKGPAAGMSSDGRSINSREPLSL